MRLHVHSTIISILFIFSFCFSLFAGNISKTKSIEKYTGKGQKTREEKFAYDTKGRLLSDSVFNFYMDSVVSSNFRVIEYIDSLNKRKTDFFTSGQLTRSLETFYRIVEGKELIDKEREYTAGGDLKKETICSYDSLLLVSKSERFVGSATRLQTTYEYFNNGLLKNEVMLENNNLKQSREYIYNFGLLSKIIIRDGNDSITGSIVNEYDLRERLVSVVFLNKLNEKMAYSQTTYNDFDSIVCIESWDRDSTKIERTERHFDDASHLLKEETVYNPDNTIREKTGYTYDSWGKLQRIDSFKNDAIISYIVYNY